jgi:hypothetical protein
MANISKEEVWRPVSGAEGKYSVSNLGRVRSEAREIKRSDGRIQKIPERICSTPPDGKGHPRVVIFYEQGSTGKTRPVHQLVMEAFVGPRPDGYETRHKNDIKTDNRLENLEYGTCSQNKYDSVRNGHHNHARLTHCKRGHEFTEENTYEFQQKTSAGNITTSRACKTCTAMRSARYHRQAMEKKAMGAK